MRSTCIILLALFCLAGCTRQTQSPTQIFVPCEPGVCDTAETTLPQDMANSSTLDDMFYVGLWTINPKKTIDLMRERGIIKNYKASEQTLLQRLRIQSEEIDMQFSSEGIFTKHYRKVNIFGKGKTSQIINLEENANDGKTANFNGECSTVERNGKAVMPVLLQAEVTKVNDKAMVLDILITNVALTLKKHEVLYLERIPGLRSKISSKKNTGIVSGQPGYDASEK